MFTAYDITQLCRLPYNGDVYYVNHYDVRALVHDIMRGALMGNYVSTSQIVVGQVASIIYHHYTSIPSQYDPHYVINNYENAGLTYPFPTGQSVPPWSSNPCDDEDDSTDDKDTVKLDRWDRLRVPVRFTRNAGLSGGNVVHVTIDGQDGSVRIEPTQRSNMITHTVDYHGNIRIKIKGAKSKCYKLNSVNHKIKADPV